eukprot:4107549-Amphidinium_carterae.1
MVGSLLQAALVLSQASGGALQLLASEKASQCRADSACRGVESEVSGGQLIVFAALWTVMVLVGLSLLRHRETKTDVTSRCTQTEVTTSTKASQSQCTYRRDSKLRHGTARQGGVLPLEHVQASEHHAVQPFCQYKVGAATKLHQVSKVSHSLVVSSILLGGSGSTPLSSGGPTEF